MKNFFLFQLIACSVRKTIYFGTWNYKRGWTKSCLIICYERLGSKGRREVSEDKNYSRKTFSLFRTSLPTYCDWKNSDKEGCEMDFVVETFSLDHKVETT